MELKNVLIVSHDALESSALARAFEAQRMPTFVYATGQEAITAVRNMKLALAIGSITLPGENILEIFRSLKALPGHEDLPCILILPRGAEYSPEDVFSYGIVDAFVRPLNVQEAVMKAMTHVATNDPHTGSHLDRAVEIALSDGSERHGRKDLFAEPDIQTNLLDSMEEEEDTEVFEDVPVEDDERLRPSPRFHREGQVFDDPVDKLNADLKRSVRTAKRNRMLIIAACIVFVGGLGAILFTGGGNERSGKDVTVIREAPGVGESSTVVPEAQPSQPVPASEDPFRDIVKEEIARRDETRRPESVQRPAKTPGVTSYSVQVGAFSLLANATQLRDRLDKRGYDVRIVEQTTSAGKTLQRVLVGQFADRGAAEAELQRLAGNDNAQGFITRSED